MKCYFCRVGEVAPGKARVVFERDGVFVVIEDVPADVCDACGEYYLSSDVMQQLEKQSEPAFAQGGRAHVMKYAA